MPTDIILIRHGETEWNKLGRLQGHLDIDLSELGRGQAALLAARLATEQALGMRFDACYSSDLSRARHTAEPVAHALGLPLHILPQLRERNYGVFQHHDKAQISALFPDAYRSWQTHDPLFAPDGGESMQTFYQRVNQALDLLVRQHAGQRILCVAHGGVLDCAYRHALQLPLQRPRAHALLNASINRLRYDAGGVQVLEWADIAHLESSADDTLAVPHAS
jgi:probable phosphoglycerate mutase